MKLFAKRPQVPGAAACMRVKQAPRHGLILLATAVLAGPASATTISISDWAGVVAGSEIIAESPTVTRFSITTTSGGNPGSDLRIDTRLDGGSAYTQRFMPFIGATYDPGTQGAAVSLDWAIDQIREPTPTGGHGWGIGLKQNGVYHLLNVYALGGTNRSTWTSFSGVDTDVATLGTLGGGTPGTLDLSATGDIIQLGLVIYSGNGGSPSRYDVTRYDNFSVTFNGVVDEPATATLALAAIGILALRRRRRAQ